MQAIPHLFGLDIQGDELMAMVVGVVFFMIPIVAILTRHQQKMAELLRGKDPHQQDTQVQALSAQVERLTQAMHAQTLVIDELSRKLNTTPPPAPKAIEEGPRAYLANE